MDFDLTTTQKMFQQMARDFAERELIPTAHEYDQSGKYPYEIYQKMAPLGLLGALIPSEYGGLGIDTLTWIIINEQLAWGSLALTLIAQSGLLAGTVIADAGNEEQKKYYLPAMCRGERIYALAAAEPNAGTDGGNIETIASISGDSIVLNGTKTFTTNANTADMIIVLAQTDKNLGGKGLALVAIEKSTDGLFTTKLTGIPGLRCDDMGQVRLVDCRVPKSNLIGEVGTGLKLALGGITNMRIAVASYCVGVGQRCIDLCVKYAQERHQFGKPIGSYQLVQGLIADMEVETQAARWLTRYAANRKDKQLSHIKEVSIAKLYATEMAVQTTVKAIRIHGGYGSFEDYTVERLNREVINFFAPGGTSEVHRLTIAKSLLGIDALSR